MKRLILFACALLFAPSLALAEPKTADEWYKEGETQYNLGNFEKAADAFKQGFALETIETKKPAYLFNVAQAYRQANRCKDAVFFYKRFISLKDQDTVKPLAAEKRADIQQRIAELEECAKTQDSIRAKPPEDTMHNDGSNGSGSATGSAGSGSGSGSATRVATKGSGDEGEEGDEGEGVTKRVPMDHPKLVTARFVAGGSKITAGNLSVPLQPSFALTAGYPIPVKSAKTLLDAGVVLSVTPLSYTNSFTGEKKSASMTEALANIGGTYAVAPKISVRGDIGIGLLFFGGIQEMGSPFTQASAGTTGTLAMFAFRVAASADYKLTPNLFATVTPVAFSFSPAKSGLRDDIKALTRIDFMLGIGYRM
ncbi:MAG: Tetratricopeptide 2 repeat protein [Myxococcales bacterium]|nr:Tetratricopeptide 2 repeat protein [Myxococcales bacterium]